VDISTFLELLNPQHPNLTSSTGQLNLHNNQQLLMPPQFKLFSVINPLPPPIINISVL
jgi:hypothetical protein